DFCERQLPRSEKRHRCLHDFLRMAFLQCDNQQIVKASPRIRTHLHDIRIDNLDQGTDHFTSRYSQKLVFLRRLSYDGSRINRIAPLRDLADMEYGKLTRVGVMTKVIPERALDPALACWNCSFEHDFRVCGHHHVQRLRSYERHSFAPDETGERHLIDI